MTIGFGEEDYVAFEDDEVATVLLTLSESPSQTVTVPLLVLTVEEFIASEIPGFTLPSTDPAECE